MTVNKVTVNIEKKLLSEMKLLCICGFKKNTLVRYNNFGSNNISIKMEVA